jgi:hypothetical protein
LQRIAELIKALRAEQFGRFGVDVRRGNDIAM